MAEVMPIDLVVLNDDEGNSVGIRDLGQHPQWSAGLAAEVCVATLFVSGCIDHSSRRARRRPGSRSASLLTRPPSTSSPTLETLSVIHSF